MSWLMRLVAIFQPRRSLIDLSSRCAGFVVDEVALGRFYYLADSCPTSPSTILNHPIIDAVLCRYLQC
jgi:hypothetical protein